MLERHNQFHRQRILGIELAFAWNLYSSFKQLGF